MANRHLKIASIGLLALLAGCGGGGGGGGGTPSPPPVDTTPNNFSFSNKTDAALSTTITAAAITITGINSATAVSITGGEYSVDGGAFTSGAGTVNNNQTITVRVSSSAQFSTATSATLTVGGLSATFTATTLAEDKTPDAFSFTAGSNTARNVVLVSNSVTISGINTVTPISITSGEYSIEGGAYTSAAGTVTNNQHVTVRLTTSGQFSTAVNAALTVGTVTGSFIATTLAADTTPDAFQFARRTDATRDTWVESASVSITGINTTTPVSVENGEYSVAGGAFTSAAGTIEPDQALVVRVKSPTVYSKSARVRVTVGGVAGDFETTAELGSGAPVAVETDGSTVYLLDGANKLVYRWSLDSGRYLDPYVIDATQSTPADMSYSPAYKRLYIGFSAGPIHYFDTTAVPPVEQVLTGMSGGVATLGDAGNFMVVQTNGGYGSGYRLNKDGVNLGTGGYYYGYSHETAWDPVTSRVYYFRDGISPNDLQFDVIDQTTGAVTSAGETPYHGSYNIIGPIRVSVNGQYVLLGSGDIYNSDQLTWAGSLASQITDARWFTNGSLVTLTTANSKTTLRRLGASKLATLEQLGFNGQALRVLGNDQRMAVVVLDNNKPRIYTYVPNDDSDGDGVPNTQDAFPLDAAASVDTDQDGYPDAWNAGRSQSDSTTGLQLDAFPQDAACWLSTHANAGGTCDFGATMPKYVPDQIVQQDDIVYLLSVTNQRVYRWSISKERYLNPYVVGVKQDFTTVAPMRMAVSAAHQRLYLGYYSGAIRYIDLASGNPAEVPFANTAMAVYGLASVGNYVLAQDESGAWATHYVINAAGAITDQKDWNYYSREYAWDANTSRVYFFRDDTSPDDLHYEVIDQSTGKITGAGETPYHGDYDIVPPIRVTADGQNILIGTGSMFEKTGLTWVRAIGSGFTDARWMGNGQLVMLTTANNQTVMQRLGTANYIAVERATITGQALRVVGSDTKMALVLVDGGTVKFQIYVPNDDVDGDGVSNIQDAFPQDRAASVDSDGDGYPDAWNAGRSQADSTTGLSLDAFPQDSACWLSSQGSGNGTCNYAAGVPNYTPDKIEQQGDIVYLLSNANRRVYRWSISSQQYRNPFILGNNQGFDSVASTSMALSTAQQRLYLGYSNGSIRYVDLAASSSAEQPFTNLATSVASLSTAGNFLLAQGSGGYNNGFIVNSNGVVTGKGGYYYGYSRQTAWDPTSNRVYYFRDGISPNDLHYDQIDQTSGTVTDTGETPYHGDYSFGGVIRVTTNGQSILVGTGDIYNKTGLTHSGSLGAFVTDARWLANGTLVTLTSSGGQTQLLRLSGSGNAFSTLEQKSYVGDALRVVGSDTAMTVLTIDNGAVRFNTFVPSDDGDGDGVVNASDAFPLDPAASVDSDHDGYPDAWNPGKTQADSTTGLTLDAFPQDSGCWLAAHGSGGVCNPASTVPNYIPDQVAQQGGVVYLLSSANKRVYRWSIANGGYLNPWIVGLNQAFSSAAPTSMAYSANHQRLYVGYPSGLVGYLDVTATNPAEATLTNMGATVNGLASAGNFLVVQAGAYYYTNTSYSVDSSGAVRGQDNSQYYIASDSTWDPVNSRLYLSNLSYPLLYQLVDQTTGAISLGATTPYNGYGGLPPVRVSVDGQTILVGGGDLYAKDLTRTGTLGATIKDARWLANGSVVALTTTTGQTQLTRLGGAGFGTLEQRTFVGDGLRVVGSDAAMVVLTVDNGTVRFTSYVPNNDIDGDGVANTADAFPTDPAASLDSDRDGYPDAWNSGKTAADSTTGLTLDAYPQEPGCWLAAHGSGGVCNPGTTVPNYVPDQVAQQGNVVYLLSGANHRVYRWSISAGAYLNPWIVGVNQGLATAAPTTLAYSPNHQRLYLGYDNGTIRYLDATATNPVEAKFATMPKSVASLTSAGNFLVAQVGTNDSNSGYVIDSGGVTRTAGVQQHSSIDPTWDPVNSRLYYASGSYWLSYDVIDQATGTIPSSGITTFTGTYVAPPARVSVDGSTVVAGSGDIYTQNLVRSGTLGTPFNDARWFTDGTLVTLAGNGAQTTLRHLAGNKLTLVEQKTYTGDALRVVGSDAKMAVLVVNNGAVQIYSYTPSNDTDGDGVANSADAFPLDAAASVDTDGDGYPDSWNAGKSQADSTTGLQLDAFPAESECWLAAHGSGGVCNYAATMPNYIPDRIQQRGDVVYLLSIANKRVYRWSIATGTYLRPYVVGANGGFTSLTPATMAYSTGQQRLYVGYSSGAIRYFDANAATPVETTLTTLSTPVTTLADAGNFLLAQGGGSIIDSNGVVVGNGGAYYGWSRESAWDPVASRVYLFSDGVSPNSLVYNEINQSTGAVMSSGETSYNGNYLISGPVRVSADGAQIVIGSGEIFARNGLAHTGSLGKTVVDGYWKDNLLVDVDTTDLVEIRDASTRTVLQTYQYLSAQPLRLVFGTSDAYLVHVLNGTTTFTRLPFYDQDGDGIPRWWEQLYANNGAGMSDTNAADATTDLDGDGINNLAEYTNHANPLKIDTDGDGLSDSAEILTWHTDPTRADSDGDGLIDFLEVNTYHSNPNDADSDDDGFSDYDEVLYGGNPTDSTVLPQPLYNYTQNFEGSPTLAGWITPPGLNGGPWTIDATQAHGGTASFKSGTTGTSQTSSVKFRGYFRPGTLNYWARIDSSNACCNHIYVLVDGVLSGYITGTNWTSYSQAITLGIHEIEWRYETSGGGDATAQAWLDDVVFAGQ